jgi:DNA end-binding protein Ku
LSNFAIPDDQRTSFHQSIAKRATASSIARSKRARARPLPADLIINGYEVGKGEQIEITDEELEAIAPHSTRTIEIDECVPRKEIDGRHNIRPCYIAPDGKVGQDAVVVIGRIIEEMEMVAMARIVLRESRAPPWQGNMGA